MTARRDLGALALALSLATRVEAQPPTGTGPPYGGDPSTGAYPPNAAPGPSGTFVPPAPGPPAGPGGSPYGPGAGGPPRWPLAPGPGAVPAPTAPPVLRSPDFYRDSDVGRPMQDYAFVLVPEPPPRIFKVHDIVTIIVNEKSETILNSRFNRQRNATLKAELKEFIRLGDSGNLRPAAEDSPTINGNLQGRIQSTGQATDTEGISYRIAATIVDILPNGNLVLEARKTIRANRELWQFSLTGKIRSQDVNRDNTALSENIAELQIEKAQRGKIYDSTKTAWGTNLFDRLFPF
jgi:flagellar L-ring protein precursor FlgH